MSYNYIIKIIFRYFSATFICKFLSAFASFLYNLSSYIWSSLYLNTKGIFLYLFFLIVLNFHIPANTQSIPILAFLRQHSLHDLLPLSKFVTRTLLKHTLTTFILQNSVFSFTS